MKEKKFPLEYEYDKTKLEREFLKYFTNIDIKLNIEKAFEIFNYHFDVDNNILNKFIDTGIRKYKNVSYHNATHALNTLSTGSVYLKYLGKHRIRSDHKFLFLVCCYLHDIGHPGLTEYRTKSLEFETYHINLVKDLIIKYFKELSTDDDFSLIEELIFSTNLLNHESILTNFKDKYFKLNNGGDYEQKDEYCVADKEIGLIELKVLIKLADISASYKKFETFIKGSELLEKEIFGNAAVRNPNKLEEDLNFLRSFAIPLAEAFSDIFTDFRFLYENGMRNLKRLEDLINLKQ
jgi:hypothetical protein